ncbi:MAG: helix-turn-helix domain-containing protein [Cellulosilyticaceae bacterium]
MINENLKKLRNSRKYTQEEVAEKLNVSRQSVAKWENGETMPDINKCKQLANLYDITLDDLVDTITGENTKSVGPKGKYMFGTVKIGERGQIVIPKKAREVFRIKPGDELLILGDISQGIAILKMDEINIFLNELMNTPVISGVDEDEDVDVDGSN